MGSPDNTYPVRIRLKTGRSEDEAEFTRKPSSVCFCPITGNYYGTPRPVHIGPESPPITYQEHRNLLRNFRTRSKSLSNLEKAVEEGDNSEEDSGPPGLKTSPICPRSPAQVLPNQAHRPAGLAGAPPTVLPLNKSWESAAGNREGTENGGGRGRRGGVPLPENWELAYSDSGEPYYIE